MITVKGREELLVVLGKLYSFQLNEKANENFLSILELHRNAKEEDVKKLARHMVINIFHDEKIAGALLSGYLNYNGSNYVFKPKPNKVITVGEKFPIGARCFSTLSSVMSIVGINNANDRDFKKYLTRCKRVLNSLEKYNKKYENNN